LELVEIMNSVERVFTALKGEIPDRVPILEFLIDKKVAKAAMPECIDVPDFMDKIDLDGVGCGAVFEKTHENPDGSFIDEWGVSYFPGPEMVPHPVDGPVKTVEDAQSYTPPDPDSDIRLEKLRKIVKRYKGKRAICFHHRAAFMWSAYLMGMEDILVNMLIEPQMVELVMDKVLECNIKIVRNAIKAGAEVIILGDDYASNSGPVMSPETFEKYILPRLKKMIDAIHEEGAFCIKHSDGNIYPLLDMIISANPDAINPIEPVAGMELKKVKSLVGEKVCITGNIDCGKLLSSGSVKEVRSAVKQAIEDAAANGGYIMTSSNSIHSSCKPENYLAMVSACHEFGSYNKYDIKEKTNAETVNYQQVH
jgi:uroporphyrinogen decarboxylase